jgi:hypothetical protein
LADPTKEMITVFPVPSTEVIVNPGKGWVLYNKVASFPPQILA